MKSRTKTATMITTYTLLSFLAAYLIADESGVVNPLVNSFIIYGVWLVVGILAGAGAVILSLLITPIRELKKQIKE